jgi:hypothetical protein
MAHRTIQRGAGILTFIVLLSCGATSAVAEKSLKPIELLELANRPLVPSAEAAQAGQAETSSIVLTGGRGCPGGCVLIGYGNGFSASLMRGPLSCLGKPGCLQPVPLAADAPGGKVTTGVGQIIKVDGTKLPSLGGELVNGACTGGTASTQDKYRSGGGTDNVLARAFDGSLLYIRAGVMLFPDPQANCVLDLRVIDFGWPASPEPSGSFRQVNIVYRSTDGGNDWSSSETQVLSGAAPGNPQTHSGLDRFDLFANPFDQTIYASGAAGTSKRGVNTSLLFASVDNGQSWTKRGSPFDNAYGPYAPLVLGATKNRLFAAVCADAVYPPQNHHPVLAWSKDGGKTWSTSEGGPLSDFHCSTLTSTANLAGSGFKPTTNIAMAPVHGTTKSDLIRLAFTTLRGSTANLHEALIGATDHQELVVVNVTVTDDDQTSVSPVTTIQAPRFGSVVRAGFVSADPTQLHDRDGADTALLWWLESDNPGFTNPARMRAKFLVSYEPNDWTKPQPLAVRLDSPPKQWLVPVEWAPAGAWGGDYDNGSFFFHNGRLNFLTQWMQEDPAAGTSRIHYNIVSVAPKAAPPLQISDPGLILRSRESLATKPGPSPCLTCPPMDLTFFASRPGPVEIELTANGRVLDRFRVTAEAGSNVVRVGSSGAAPPPGTRSLRFTVAVQPVGQPGRLTRTIDATAPQKILIRQGTGMGPSEPVGRLRGPAARAKSGNRKRNVSNQAATTYGP